MARYGSPEGFGSDVHASRLIAPDARDLTPGDASSSAPDSVVFLCVLVTILTAMLILARENRPWKAIESDSLRTSAGTYIYPQIAFRPPPAR